VKSEYHDKASPRLAPAEFLLDFGNIAVRTKLDYENTRHRYPWVCSLRTVGAIPEHVCAVTLLSIPPKPTVLVGAAHCTYICKNTEQVAIPSCCCSDVADTCVEDKDKCGDKPEVFEMTGGDVEVRCGEWDTGPQPWTVSGEEYNIVLPIKEIVRHPGYNASEGAGPVAGNDLVIFKVDDSAIKRRAGSIKLYPICLPSIEKQQSGPRTGIHTGWSKPPPIRFVYERAPGYLRFYGDFYKQWHYRMNIDDKCRDLPINIFGEIYENPSNSYYPPGIVCAKEKTKTCFSIGESGSPLMVAEKNRPQRYYAEGLLSYVKGCSFYFGQPYYGDNTWMLDQYTNNPSTYTKLSCFLPWVAEQYGLEYKTSGHTDPACTQGQGEQVDTAEECTASEFVGYLDGPFSPCIFPYYVDGTRYDKCGVFTKSDSIYPTFLCPVFNSTITIDGINSFPASAVTEGLCPVPDTVGTVSDYDYFYNDDYDYETVDPTIEDCPYREAVFWECNTNCEGVQGNGVVAAGAFLSFTATITALQTLQAIGPAVVGVGALGAAGIGGGAMVVQSVCPVPFFCRVISGKCCMVVISLFGSLLCPDTC